MHFTKIGQLALAIIVIVTSSVTLGSVKALQAAAPAPSAPAAGASAPLLTVGLNQVNYATSFVLAIAVITACSQAFDLYKGATHAKRMIEAGQVLSAILGGAALVGLNEVDCKDCTSQKNAVRAATGSVVVNVLFLVSSVFLDGRMGGGMSGGMKPGFNFPNTSLRRW